MSINRPNILFIMTDEQRFDAVGYVNPQVITPNLDKLSNESIVFENAYTTSPSCIPARAAVFTGKYPSQCDAPTYITHLPDDEVMFMSLLQQAGYHTAVVGKQHFGSTNIKRGYDYEEINDMHFPKFNPSGKGSSYTLFLEENGFSEGSQLYEREGKYTYKWKEDVKFHIDHFIGERGKRWLKEKRPSEKPWFLCVSFPGPHQPFDGIGLPHAELYDEKTIGLPHTKESNLDEKPPHYMVQLETGHGNPGQMPVKGTSEADIKRTRLSYFAKMSLIDEKIGEIISALKETGEYENTMIIFTSDHGDFMGDFGMMGKGQYLSEALMHIPFLIKPPISQFCGRKESSFVSSVEIAATCLKVANVPIPENISGRSLDQFWSKDADIEVWEDIYMEAQDIRAIRTKRWKFIYYQNRCYGELYDIKNDPWEKHNLWDDVSLSKIKADLMAAMLNWLIKLGKRSHVPWNKDAPTI
ncbi:MAG: sulfatase-like hydrolase/transferase [Firmicutes bacterium]|nr:sulfatase-like hydrolase/transferase [Bacillota bacterium]